MSLFNGERSLTGPDISSPPIQQQEDATSSENTSDNQAKKTTTKVISVIAEPSNTEKADRAAEQEKNYRYQRIGLRIQGALCFFTALAFGAAAYYAYVAKSQECTMASTLAEVRKQNELSLQQIKGTQAAMVHMLLGIGRNPYRLTVQASNSGHVIANKIVAHIIVTIRELPGRKQKARFEFDWGPETLAPAGDINPIGPTQKSKSFDIPGYDEAAIESARLFRWTMRVESAFSYENGFGDKLSSSNCVDMVAVGYTSADPEQAQVGQVNCDDFESTVATTLKNKKAVEEEAKSKK
jgi:hypothetical protein